MSPPPRLVATDLDGTLLGADGLLSPRTAATLERVRTAGAEVVFVTGRPPRWMTEVAHLTSAGSPAICSNGALLVDLASDRVVAAHLLEPAVLTDVMDAIAKRLPGAAFAGEYGWEFVAEPAFEAPDVPGCTPGDRTDIAARAAAKLLVRYPGLTTDALLAEVADAVGPLATCTHSSLTVRMVEISAPGVTKASALATYCAERDIAAGEVAAFGDMPNDLEMLAWAGRAYAVANAHPEVLAAVDEHVPAHDADGVAATLERLYAL